MQSITERERRNLRKRLSEPMENRPIMGDPDYEILVVSRQVSALLDLADERDRIAAALANLRRMVGALIPGVCRLLADLDTERESHQRTRDSLVRESSLVCFQQGQALFEWNFQSLGAEPSPLEIEARDQAGMLEQVHNGALEILRNAGATGHDLISCVREVIDQKGPVGPPVPTYGEPVAAVIDRLTRERDEARSAWAHDSTEVAHAFDLLGRIVSRNGCNPQMVQEAERLIGGPRRG